MWTKADLLKTEADLLEYDMHQYSELKEIYDSAVKVNADRAVVVKAFIPQSLKVQFKVCCIQRELKMSAVLEHLIRQWIASGSTDLEPVANPCDEPVEEVKGYIPRALKQQFKVLCTQNHIQMSYLLHSLIQKWLAENCSELDQVRN
ncbi:MAG: hypothetical protein ACFBSF_06075 [Leptolyngbyaceae cyanobacterium]